MRFAPTLHHAIDCVALALLLYAVVVLTTAGGYRGVNEHILALVQGLQSSSVLSLSMERVQPRCPRR